MGSQSLSRIASWHNTEFQLITKAEARYSFSVAYFPSAMATMD